MAWRFTNLTLDLENDTTAASLYDDATSTSVSVNVKIKTPGNSAENELKKIARAAVKKALQDAAASV